MADVVASSYDSKAIEGHSQVLTEISNKNRNVDEVRKAVDAREGNIEHELEIAKDHLSKLKFNFTELNTKAAFVHAVTSLEFGATPQQMIPDDVIAASKEEVQELKSRNNQLRDELRQTTSEIASALEDVEVENEECIALLEEVKEAAEEYTLLYDQFQRQKTELEGVEITDDPMAELEAMEAELARLASDEAELDAAITRTQQQTAEAQTTLAKEEADVIQLQDQVASEQAQADRHLRQAYEDITLSNDMMSALTGVIVERIGDECVDYSIKGFGDRVHHLAVVKDASTNAITQALLDGSDALIRQHTKTAIASNDMQGVINAACYFLYLRYASEENTFG
eukprot:TRINITY_DN4588_c0_g1_i1.p1 TRINITY_DN4588_c0_g1~~TRINITY_DN4588_c0_g1_i1.p1  ORF type:complete len:341 (+),score=101.83 TRINITY_DN4588_c0_g1_i1:12-1034(+)